MRFSSPLMILMCVQWCCSLEQHISAGVHYHMTIKLDRNKRWISSKRFLLESCGISVHFSEIHSNYYSAWKYVTKEDKHYIQSLDHPDLTNTGPSRTTMASIAVQSRSKRKQATMLGKTLPMSPMWAIITLKLARIQMQITIKLSEGKNG